MKITINKIATSAIVGCYLHERSQPQDLTIDLDIKLYPYNWINQDTLDTTVNYDELIDYITEIISKTNYQLLESLAQFINNKILDKYSLIQKIHIELTKVVLCGVKAQEIKVSCTQKRQFQVALALGSNWEFLPQQQLITAIEMLGEYLNNIKIGGFYETKPVGFTYQRNFYNTAIVGDTTLKPEKLLSKIKSIEKLMGKEERIINGPRIIDIDLILFADLIYSHNFLNIPHKMAHLRDFVLTPLADIAPQWLHPVLNKPIIEIATELSKNDTSILKKIEYYKK